jgi:hypothetical protein
LLQYTEVAEGLCISQGAECVGRAGYLTVLFVHSGDLEKQAGVRPALVQLAGGMEEAGP